MIQKFETPNGVRIVLEKIPTVRSVSIGIWIGTGSRFETTEDNGVSHFLEHMFFKGTKTRSAKEIAEAFDGIGGQVNAFTSKEYTCYYAKVLDDHASIALDVLSDMYFHSLFEEKELEKEKNVVLEEIKMYEDAPDDIVHDLLAQASFGTHSLGYPILGTQQTLKSFSERTLRDYMSQQYTAENVVISIAGNVDEDFIGKVEAIFKDVEKSGVEREYVTPSFLAEKLVRKKETEQAHLCLGFDGLPIGHKDIYSLVLLNNILGGSMSSRLFQEVREKKGLAYSVFSYHSSYHDNGMLTVYSGTAPNQLDELFDTMMETLNSIKSQGITEKELTKGKEQLKGNLMLSLESTNSRMSRNGKNELLLKRHRSLDEIIDEINRVSITNVNKLSKNLFSQPYSLSLISPQGKLPTGI
ncbi:peptidase M16 [Anaerobacillus alkalidiazotrophicus]|uniref:Peptidase M16 n=1 Tax=Anaerobacillus alkalidiazotrophicus TaxID=472963 RepID=A0A1S2M2K3_9BACI|nr:pitrilysin family protein [Anaerobacillus alkalidiazotrophicus]OIJ17885.1 peptidase M16 [Anaerobacillus alkalidiazotrophicus]